VSDAIDFGTSVGAARVDLLDHSHARLVGATLRWKRYRSWTSNRPAGRCELCGAQFTEGGRPGLNSGYSVIGGGPASQDDHRWICAICYDLRRDHFCWTVLDSRGTVYQPRDLLDAALGWAAWPAPATVDDDVDGAE
jgi:hypothetical protein